MTNAAVHGFERAIGDGATVHVLYVVETDYQVAVSSGGAGDIAALDRTIQPTLETKGTEITDGLTKQAAEIGLETVRAVRSGHARDTIVRHATEHDIDLVVVGHTVVAASSDCCLEASPSSCYAPHWCRH